MGRLDVQSSEDLGQASIINAEGEVGHEQGVLGRGPITTTLTKTTKQDNKTRRGKPGGFLGLGGTGGTRGTGATSRGSTTLGRGRGSTTLNGGTSSLGSSPWAASTAGRSATATASSSPVDKPC